MGWHEEFHAGNIWDLICFFWWSRKHTIFMHAHKLNIYRFLQNVCLIKSYFRKHQKSFKTILNNLFCIWYICSVMLDRWFEYNSNYYFQCFIILMLSDSIIRSCNISKWPDTYCISEIRLCRALFIPVCVNINNSI